jgi:hypothetical protein
MPPSDQTAERARQAKRQLDARTHASNLVAYFKTTSTDQLIADFQMLNALVAGQACDARELANIASRVFFGTPARALKLTIEGHALWEGTGDPAAALGLLYHFLAGLHLPAKRPNDTLLNAYFAGA